MTLEEAMQAHENNNEDFLSFARSIAEDMMEDGRTALRADDHRTEVEAICAEKGYPLPTEPRVWGAVFRGPGWIKTGSVASNRPNQHRRPIAVWRFA